MGRLFIALGLCALAASPAAMAQAQRAPRPTREYQRTIRSAISEFNEGRWEEARALFREANEMYPNARSLRGIGMASFEMREYAVAHDALLEALASEIRPLTRGQRRETEELLDRARRFIGRVRVVVSPPEAALQVDLREPRFADDGSMLLDVGEHSLSATLEGFRPSTQQLVVEGGEDTTIRIALQSNTPDEAVVEAAPAAGGSGDLFDRPLALAGLVVLASAGAPLVAMLGGVGWFADRDGELGLCRSVSSTQRCLNEDTIASEHDASVGFTIAMGVTAALAGGAGLTLLLLGLDESGSEAEALVCTPTVGGAACAGRF